MKKNFRILFAGLLAAGAFASFNAPQPALANAPAAKRMPSDVILLGPAAKVAQVVDGNTIIVSLNGSPATVRLIGVNAPALSACGGAAAKTALANLLAGQVDVILEKDVTDADASGALLRYVYLRDARMANEEVIAAGAARAITQLPNTKHQLALNDLEAAARKAMRGGWRTCGWKSPAGSITQCATVNAQDLITRGDRPAAVNLLRDGDCVIIQKDVNANGPAWSGEYIYHPAGSAAKLGQGYVRWKDGFVMLANDPAQSGALSATVDEDRRKFIEITRAGRTFNLPIGMEHFGSLLPLERDPGNAGIVRLPVIGTWLFQDLGNGKFSPLVDYFEYVSGDLTWPRLAEDGQLY